jgi:hypothetical protein
MKMKLGLEAHAVVSLVPRYVYTRVVCFVDTKVSSRVDEHQEGSNCENQKISAIEAHSSISVIGM